MSKLGFRTVSEMVGRTDLLVQTDNVQEPHQGPHHNGDDDEQRNTQNGLGGEVRVIGSVAAQRHGPGVHETDAVDNGLHTQGGDKGRHLEFGNY